MEIFVTFSSSRAFQRKAKLQKNVPKIYGALANSAGADLETTRNYVRNQGAAHQTTLSRFLSGSKV